MSNAALLVHRLSKSFRIGVAPDRTAQKNPVARILGAPFRYLASSLRAPTADETLWALRDVSFEIQHGEVLGIIGKNGAGKSTLLKIISRIIEPTDGRVVVYGRVGSLLEVGTGFHPQLTGRENIYLSGIILGMKRKEIDRKFDEIVSFSELERFLDTPVKRYSSGMYVRLAFAVAAHLDPDLLLVDEVLAVGDVEFQKRCLGKMGTVASEGRTVILVSHQMNMIRNLSTRCLLLEKGQVVEFGEPETVMKTYLKGRKVQSTEWLPQATKEESLRKFSRYLDLKRFALVDANGNAVSNDLSPVDTVFVQIEGLIKDSDAYVGLGFSLYDADENNLMWSFQTDQPEEKWPPLPMGPFALRTQLDLSILNEGKYRLVFTGFIYYTGLFQTEVTISFELTGNGSGSPYWVDRRKTLLAPALQWKKVEPLSR